MQRVRAIAHISFWLVLLTVFFWVNVPKIFYRAPRGSVSPTGDLSFHSSDALLHFTTGARDGSARLTAFFGAAPAGKRIVVLDHQDDPSSSLMGMLTAYLAWPHPVELVDLVRTRSDRADVIKLDRTPPAAIIFCRVGRPSDLPEGRMFGHGFEIVPIAMD